MDDAMVLCPICKARVYVLYIRVLKYCPNCETPIKIVYKPRPPKKEKGE